MTEEVCFFVVGTPRPAGSKDTRIVMEGSKEKGTRRPAINPKTGLPRIQVFDHSGDLGKTWRADIRAEALEAMAGYPVMQGPLRVDLRFRFPRPKRHYGSGVSTINVLKLDAPHWHTSTPDIDKASRAVLDALKGIVWVDDKQVADKRVTKVYAERHLGEREGVSISVIPLSGMNPDAPSEMTVPSDDSDEPLRLAV